MNKMSASDQKIGRAILENPAEVINITISQLAKKAKVSDASITRFCRNLSLSGFHELKILLAQSMGQKESESLRELPKDDIQAALAQIEKNKQKRPLNKIRRIRFAYDGHSCGCCYNFKHGCKPV